MLKGCDNAIIIKLNKNKRKNSKCVNIKWNSNKINVILIKIVIK